MRKMFSENQIKSMASNVAEEISQQEIKKSMSEICEIDQYEDEEEVLITTLTFKKPYIPQYMVLQDSQDNYSFLQLLMESDGTFGYVIPYSDSQDVEIASGSFNEDESILEIRGLSGVNTTIVNEAYLIAGNFQMEI